MSMWCTLGPPSITVGQPRRCSRCTLTCVAHPRAGELDLLGEVAGGGSHEALLVNSRRLELFGTQCW